MIGTLEGTQHPDVVKDFVRHYWVSRNGPTRKQELCDAIKERAPNKANPLDLLSKLHSSSGRYVAVLNPLNGFWKGYTDRARRNLLTLGNLGVKQIRRFFRHLLKDSQSEIVTEGKIKDAQSLAYELSSTVPADEAFESFFATMTVTKPSVARYYLRVLEQTSKWG